MHVNPLIVSGWLPLVVGALAVASLVASLGVPSGPWRRQLALGVPAAGVAGGAAALVVRLLGVPGAGFPWSVVAWTAGLVLGAVSGAVGWPVARWWRRAASVAAVVLTAVMVLGSINSGYVRFPTLDRLFGFQGENLVAAPRLQALRADTLASGRLPAQGVVVTEHIPAPASGFEALPALVYLPPAWFAPDRPRLPAVVLLPGEPGTPSDWVEAGSADTIADRFAAAHGGRAPILVMPDPNGVRTVDSECVDSRFGKAETYLTQDVPAFARRALGAADGPGSLALAGLSAGGTCSSMLALRHPGVYRTFASYSGFAHPIYRDQSRQGTIETLFGGSTSAYLDHDPATLLERRHYTDVAGWLESGDADPGPLAAARQLAAAATPAGVDVCLLVRPGGHDFGLWSQALTDSLPWLSWRTGLTGPPASVPATCQPPVP